MQTEDKATPLLPCPFCGKNKAAWGEGEQKTKYGNEQVYCSWCLAITAPEMTKEEAAKNWNTRSVNQSQHVSALAEALKACDEYFTEHLSQVPDYALRRRLREQADTLTRAALAAMGEQS